MPWTMIAAIVLGNSCEKLLKSLGLLVNDFYLHGYPGATINQQDMLTDQISSVLITLGQSTVFALALVALYSMARYRVRSWSSRQKTVVDGLAFGTAVIVAMQFPVQIQLGVSVDARDVVILLSGLFGGLGVAAIATSIAALYGLISDGVATVANTGASVTAAAIGSGFFWLLERRSKPLAPQHFLLAGLLLAPVSLAWNFTLPGAMPASQIVAFLLVPVTVLYPLAALFYGTFLNWEVRRMARESKLAETVRALRESENKYRTLVESSPYCIHQIDVNGQFISMNGAGLKMLNLEREDKILGAPVLSMVCDRDRKRISKLMGAALAGEYAEFEFRSPDNTNFRSNFVPILNDEGTVDRLLGLTQDITHHQRVEQAKNASENLLRMVTDALPALVSYIDQDHRFRFGNLEYQRRYLISPDDMLGQKVEQVIGSETYGRLKPYIDRALSGEIVTYMDDAFDLEGQRWCTQETRLPVRGDSNEVQGIVTIAHDITRQKYVEENLAHQATHDTLTGLINRSEFERRLARVLDTPQVEHSLCYLDLDQFKVINDICGHMAGDELLRQVGQLLSMFVRKRDTLARLGGDEFGVLMEHCKLPQAYRIADKLRKAIEEFRFVWRMRVFRIGVSIGLVPITETSGNVNNVLSAADSACYVAKDEGRNRVHVYHPDDSDLARRHGEMQWVARIDHALEDNRLQLWSQPIVSTTKTPDEGEKFELLLRLVDERGKIILPGAFLPAAERYGLTVKLDRWVIAAAFDWLNRNPKRLDRLQLCFINLSGISLSNEEFLTYVLEQMERSQIPSRKICFEITETTAIANLPRAMTLMSALKKRGCRFALDDFGSGLSSFAYLKTLPVDFLKIDGTFVKDIVGDSVDLALVRSINDVGKAMGKQTIAESVESDAILQKLRHIGVDYAQGYGIGRPTIIQQTTVFDATTTESPGLTLTE